MEHVQRHWSAMYTKSPVTGLSSVHS